MKPALDPSFTPIQVRELARILGARYEGNGAVELTGVHQDSRRVQPGDLFVARRGEKTDGWKFLPQAIERGARAVMVDKAHAPSSAPLPMILVDDILRDIGRAACAVYGAPTTKLQVVGITGTNGKTTTTHLLRAALESTGARPAVLGTLGTYFEDHHFDTGHTTPEADDLIRRCRQVLDLGASHLLMEVSSHALALHRADAVRFEVAAFTNLTQDHLDFHGSLQAYGKAKKRLFLDLAPKKAVVMVDDPFGAELHRQLAGQRAPESVLAVSVRDDASADVHPTGRVRLDARGIECDVQLPDGSLHLTAPLLGEHNLANLLLALGIVHALGVSTERAASGLARVAPVPGRMERCELPADDVVVVVDYAHTPDALRRALQTLRPLTAGRLWCVFGAGGDRDQGKRASMGRVVAELADEAIVTNDNPRSESPQAIARQILEGMTGGKATVREQLDRSRAIVEAVTLAARGDVILIAGKGHEPYQIIGERVLAFDDREQARRALAMRRANKE